MATNPMVQIARVFEKVSSNGNRYFVGRLGPSRVLMFKDERSESEDPEWQIFVAEVDAKSDTTKARQAPKQSQKTLGDHTRAQAPRLGSRGGDDPDGFFHGRTDG